MFEYAEGKFSVLETEHMFGFDVQFCRVERREQPDGTAMVVHRPICILSRSKEMDAIDRIHARRAVVALMCDDWATYTGITQRLAQG